ncbi:helix-turn-helix domain-containing protein [Phreatobacter stygius]|nr:helix-turn-helix domain-containing protein [Phreatobacter stygius]
MGKNWHRQDIIAAVRKRGSSLQRLGKEHGFARDTFNKALTARFPNAHAIIAEFIGVERHELWPQWYGPDGQMLFSARADLHTRMTLQVA